MKPTAYTRLRAVLILASLLVAFSLLAGCGSERPPDVSGAPGPPGEPATADLSTPGAAVTSYLDWVSHAYRTLDSAVASHTMTPWEGVRVDSYIELNRQQDRGIDQTLLLFQERALDSVDGTATLAAHEEWAYRYFSLQSGLYISEPLTASYDATYTVVRSASGDWQVDSVDVTALTEVE